MYAIIQDPDTLTQALKLARGRYQRAILTGSEALSGATLKGTARKYGDRYARSAATVIARCKAHGLNVSECRGEHNKRMVFIGPSYQDL